MPQIVNLSLNPAAAADNNIIRKNAAIVSKTDVNAIAEVRILKKSVDARSRNIKVNLTVEIILEGESVTSLIRPFEARNVALSKQVIIAGAGPAGLFAALRLIELGIRPVIVERGREVSARKRDIALISREHIVNPDSNYCFGEGGAGTFSDGKLYTRSKKTGENHRVIEMLVLHGADPTLLYEAHPPLGTDKLPGIISTVRKSILDCGGLILFETRITDFIITGGRCKGIVTAGGESIKGEAVILATGHSARDIYEICVNRDIAVEGKAFAMGVRVEHPQELIDKIQYHGSGRGEYLPAAAYSLAKQVDGRGVYSFCMCPGGFIVPSATSPGEVVVNGMSPSGRNSPYANSGIVVELHPGDFPEYSQFGHLAGLHAQHELEKLAWKEGGSTQKAPAQRVSDFLAGRESSTLPKVSYFPGITSSEMNGWLPKIIGGRLKEGFRQFGNMMKGFNTSDAVILGVESRTSSPVRIPRNTDTMEHIGIKGLYPCGEGSGYAGGIVSSAIDGMKAAESIANVLN